MSPNSKVSSRRAATREKARKLLHAVASGEVDAYVGYRQLYGVWCSNNAATQDLRPLFRIPGVEPDGTLSVTPQFRDLVVALSKEILLKFQD
jgi:hypothetical protein